MFFHASPGNHARHHAHDVTIASPQQLPSRLPRLQIKTLTITFFVHLKEASSLHHHPLLNITLFKKEIEKWEEKSQKWVEKW